LVGIIRKLFSGNPPAAGLAMPKPQAQGGR
jgi:hypothetical protein